MTLNREQLMTAGLDCARLLEQLDITKVTQTGDELNACCIFHDDRKPSFRVNQTNGLFYCHGCGAKGDVIDLVRKKKELGFFEACQWLMEFCGLKGQPEEFLMLMRQYAESNRFIDTMAQRTEMPQYWDEALVQQLSKDRREFYLEKGFTHEILDLFQVGYAVLHMTERLFFPVRDATGKLLGLSGRRIGDETQGHKWMHSEGLNKSHVLFHLHCAKEYATIDHVRELFVVEGPVDCMKATLFGVRNVVAVLGHGISEEQYKLLMQHAHRIILALDNDPAGQQGTKEAIEKLKHDWEVYTLPLPMGKDVGDCTQEEFTTACQQKIRVR